MTEKNSQHLAVLIDADNAQPAIIEALLAEIAKYGVASTKRIYGDWTSQQMSGWKEVLLEFSLHPMQQFPYTRGKNATDSAMIIDAMDLLYTNKFDGFCLVSSDSDFTRLAARLRESGLTVYGFGEKKTPQPFVAACDKFIYTELLRNKTAEETEMPSAQKSANELRQNTRLLTLIRNAIDDSADELGWAALGAVGTLIGKQAPEFDARIYGYKRLSDLVRAIGLFEIDERSFNDGRTKQIYIRDKRKSAKR